MVQMMRVPIALSAQFRLENDRKVARGNRTLTTEDEPEAK